MDTFEVIKDLKSEKNELLKFLKKNINKGKLKQKGYSFVHPFESPITIEEKADNKCVCINYLTRYATLICRDIDDSTIYDCVLYYKDEANIYYAGYYKLRKTCASAISYEYGADMNKILQYFRIKYTGNVPDININEINVLAFNKGVDVSNKLRIPEGNKSIEDKEFNCKIMIREVMRCDLVGEKKGGERFVIVRKGTPLEAVGIIKLKSEEEVTILYDDQKLFTINVDKIDANSFILAQIRVAWNGRVFTRKKSNFTCKK